MNRRRELALQRLSRIGSLAAAESAPKAAKARGKLTIEAAIGTYMMKDNSIYPMRPVQDTYTSGDSLQQEKEHLSRQMAEYMSAVEESQLANARADMAYNHSFDDIDDEKLEELLAQDSSARYQLSRYLDTPQDGMQSAYDRLDANRCSGFLLYSYNKNGVHSVLGEHITPGSYGGRITNGDFISKA